MDVMQTLLHQIEQAREHDDLPLEAESLSTLGDLHYEVQKLDEALQAYEQSLLLFQEMGNAQRVAGTQVRLADVYSAKQEWQLAIEQCENAHATLEGDGDELGMVRTYTNLGILYWQIGEWRRALECYQKRLAILQRIGDVAEAANVSATLGMLYQVVGHREYAARYLAEAYLAAQREGLDELAERASTQLGNVFGSTEAATAYLAHLTEGEVLPLVFSEDQTEAMDRLLDAVAEALAGDDELAQQLSTYTSDLARDAAQPPDARALGRALAQILEGQASPDLTALPQELAGRLGDWLAARPATS